ARLPKFHDAATREALGLLTDRTKTLADFSKGLRPATNGPWGIRSPYQCAPEECPILPFDPAKARKLLAAAGWKDEDGNGCLERDSEGNTVELAFTILAEAGEWARSVLAVYTA